MKFKIGQKVAFDGKQPNSRLNPSCICPKDDEVCTISGRADSVDYAYKLKEYPFGLFGTPQAFDQKYLIPIDENSEEQELEKVKIVYVPIPETVKKEAVELIDNTN